MSSQPGTHSSIDARRGQCAKVGELLPWWVNQTLAGEQRRLVEEHLGSCLVCRRELPGLRSLLAASEEHVPAEDLVHHAMGLASTGWSQSAIADHLDRCGECRDLFDTVRGIEDREAGDQVSGRQTAGDSGAGRSRWARRTFGAQIAAAAAVVLCLLGLGALRMQRGTAPQSADRTSAETVAEALESPRDSTFLFTEGFESGDPSRWSLVVQSGADGGNELEIGNKSEIGNQLGSGNKPGSEKPRREA